MTKKIVLLSQNTQFIQSLRLALAEQGIEILDTGNGLDGYRAIEEKIPSAVIADMELARVNGYQLALIMQNNPKCAAIPLLLVNSENKPGFSEQRARQSGFSAAFGHPVEISKLAAAVAKL
jgi:CheY-like chemotaxis protein